MRIFGEPTIVLLDRKNTKLDLMKHLLIIGARGCGRGTYETATTMQTYGEVFDIKGFLDDNTQALDGFEGYPPIIDSVEHYEIQPDDVFICALGDVEYKKKYVQMILDKGGEFMNIIHKTAFVSKYAKLGEGCIIGTFSKIDCNATIDDYTIIQAHATIGHDSHVGKFSIIDCYCFMGGFSDVGECVTMHTRSTLIPAKKIGDGATINVASVVIYDVKPNSVMMGNPARRLIIPNIKGDGKA